MSIIEIRKISSKADILKFIKFQWEIYKNDSHWVPPLIMDRKKALNKEVNPFFEHASAEYFLAYKDNKIVGRIAAIRNDLHNSTHNEKTGFFGFFECFDDQEVANKLLDTAKEWCKTENMTIMRGPASPSSNDEWGSLIEGFDDSPRMLMAYNPSYYNKLYENYGLVKAKDLFAYKVEYDKVNASEKLRRVAGLSEKRYNMKIRSVDMKNFNAELEKVKMVYNKAWLPNWGFVPFTDKEIDFAANDLKQLADPNLILFGEVDGQTVGFALTMHDYNFIFKKMNGKLFPFGFIHMINAKKSIPWVRIMILGLIPEFQKKGLDAVFYREIMDRGHKIGIDLGEASWILEDNEMMNKSAQVMNAHIYKKYRVYDLPI